MNGFNFIVIPSVDKEGVTIPLYYRDEVLKFAIDEMAKTFGGVTIDQKDGVWKNDEGVFVSEKVTVLSSFGYQAHPFMLALAKQLKEKLSQEAVMFGFTPSEVTFV